MGCDGLGGLLDGIFLCILFVLDFFSGIIGRHFLVYSFCWYIWCLLFYVTLNHTKTNSVHPDVNWSSRGDIRDVWRPVTTRRIKTPTSKTRKSKTRKSKTRNRLPHQTKQQKGREKEREEKSKAGGEKREKTEIALQNLESIKYGLRFELPNCAIMAWENITLCINFSISYRWWLSLVVVVGGCAGCRCPGCRCAGYRCALFSFDPSRPYRPP